MPPHRALALDTPHAPDAQDPFPHASFARIARALRDSLAPERCGFDPYALDRRDPALVREALPALEWFSRCYVRLRASGLEHLHGAPALLVANHNGGVMGPDLFCTMATLWRALGPDAPLYAMAHDFAMRRVLPLGRLLQRIGAMRADPANALRVLRSGGRVLVYPGGDLDAFRHFRARDRVVFGTRVGFVRIAQAARVPIVPIVTHGAHRSAIIVHEGEWLARALGLTHWSRLQRFPIALALPWIVAPGPWMPYFPLPFAIRLRVLPPIDAPSHADPAAIRDDVVARMQSAMDDLAREAAERR
ncbi:1-acyl-sn-glycerol-3-phosphate acyltransferase [Sandaracinus amylolyticus]|uniref:1-acyl-sn-glycerol-3-phosphate acyltransferase n=1 Tax=Sandaracinus amylolyticus TaxID=927083 RepID=UPI001F02BB64|nr:1-acyl-sn-glycerol-3-phosphate acyltransferase [Sandaracinus amylolyticus]UJR81168.1 Acyl-phosphate glycerol 3-phosphate acyltransferase [Sandaracinus amylolyticus]